MDNLQWRSVAVCCTEEELVLFCSSIQSKTCGTALEAIQRLNISLEDFREKSFP
jgi:hypothetical protein